jgi:hypothetical protein
LLGRFVFAASLVVVAAAAFGAASYAVDSRDEPRLRSNLSAGALPTSSLSASEELVIDNLIGRVGGARYGISRDSYREVRTLSHTPVGMLYLIPGSRGVCVAVRLAVACGDPGAPGSPLLSLLVRAPSGVMVGGGITTDTIDRVKVVTKSGHSQTFAVTTGVFVVPAGAGIKPNTLYVVPG